MTGPPNDLLEETVRRLNARGVVVVAAAGNGGPSAPPAYPAAYGDVVSVTAVDRELRPYRMANRGEYISFSSPGVQIWSAGEAGSGRRRTGTSFAAAHASAIIADVVRRGGRADISKALGALQSTARDLGVPGKDPIFGWGLIQGTPACRESDVRAALPPRPQATLEEISRFPKKIGIKQGPRPFSMRTGVVRPGPWHQRAGLREVWEGGSRPWHPSFPEGSDAPSSPVGLPRLRTSTSVCNVRGRFTGE